MAKIWKGFSGNTRCGRADHLIQSTGWPRLRRARDEANGGRRNRSRRRFLLATVFGSMLGIFGNGFTRWADEGDAPSNAEFCKVSSLGILP